jgi:hypothetical protein
VPVNRNGARVALILAIVVYFPVKLYLLQTFHPPFWLRFVMAALFWGALFTFGIISERSRSLVQHDRR